MIPAAAVSQDTVNGDNLDNNQTVSTTKIRVDRQAADTEIAERLENIFTSTGWFKTPQVKVKDGVVSLPDEAREVLFPQGVPVRMLTNESQQKDPASKYTDRRHSQKEQYENEAESAAEGGLLTDAHEIESQAKNSRQPEEGASILIEK